MSNNLKSVPSTRSSLRKPFDVLEYIEIENFEKVESIKLEIISPDRDAESFEIKVSSKTTKLPFPLILDFLEKVDYKITLSDPTQEYSYVGYDNKFEQTEFNLIFTYNKIQYMAVYRAGDLLISTKDKINYLFVNDKYTIQTVPANTYIGVKVENFENVKATLKIDTRSISFNLTDKQTMFPFPIFTEFLPYKTIKIEFSPQVTDFEFIGIYKDLRDFQGKLLSYEFKDNLALFYNNDVMFVHDENTDGSMLEKIKEFRKANGGDPASEATSSLA